MFLVSFVLFGVLPGGQRPGLTQLEGDTKAMFQHTVTVYKEGKSKA